MESKRSLELKVGLMVAAGLVLFMITVVMLGGDKKFLSQQYILKVHFESIEGLNKGSVVQLLGLPVGNVSQIDFSPEKNLLEVSLKINKTHQNRITKGSVAGLRTQGALGDKYIYIRPNSESKESLTDGSTLESEGGGDFMSTLTRRGSELQKIFDILDETHKLIRNLNSENQAGSILKNLNQTTQDLKKLSANLSSAFDPEMSKQIKKTANHLSSVMAKIDSGQGTLGALINDPSISEDIKRILGNSKTNRNLKGLIRETIQKGSSESPGNN